MFTAAERIEIHQILRPMSRSSELEGILIATTDPDTIAAVRASLTQWAQIQTARNPKQVGLTKADVVEWNPQERCKALCHLEATTRSNLAIALNFSLEEVFPF